MTSETQALLDLAELRMFADELHNQAEKSLVHQAIDTIQTLTAQNTAMAEALEEVRRRTQSMTVFCDQPAKELRDLIDAALNDQGEG